MDRCGLVRRVYETSHIEGHLVLRSGRTSNEYFDKYLFEADPVLLKSIAENMVGLIPSGCDALAGLEMGGIPIVTMLSQLTGLPALFVRKKAKEYGTCKLAEGGEVAGKRLAVVEDGGIGLIGIREGFVRVLCATHHLEATQMSGVIGQAVLTAAVVVLSRSEKTPVPFSQRPFPTPVVLVGM